MPEKKFVLAVRHGAAEATSSDWRQQLSQIPGVRILGGSDRRVQFVTEDEGAADRVRSTFGPDYIVEEIVGREPL